MGHLARAFWPSGPTLGKPPYSFLLSPGDVVPMEPILITALSHRAAVGGGTFLGVPKPRAWIFYGLLTGWVPVLPNLIWSKPFLPRHEPSLPRMIIILI
jgi:hypothetical protein